MKREIKFRAWVPKLKRMGKVSEINFTTGTLAVATNPIFSEIFRLRQVRLMQYIGLNDANGNPIYEGDIITVQATNDDGSTDGMLGRIDYDADIASFGFAVIGRDNWDNYSFDNLFEEGFVDLRVIGNVHTNPELLEGNK